MFHARASLNFFSEYALSASTLVPRSPDTSPLGPGESVFEIQQRKCFINCENTLIGYDVYTFLLI